MLRRVSVTASLTLILAIAFLGATPSFSHGEDHVHESPASLPADDFALSDAMRLVALDFGTLREHAGQVESDPKAQEKIATASANAQRYLRIAELRWAPDRAFAGYAADARSAWTEAGAAAQAGDLSATLSAVKTVGATCKACHDAYQD